MCYSYCETCDQFRPSFRTERRLFFSATDKLQLELDTTEYAVRLLR